MISRETTQPLARILARSYYAISDKPLLGDSSKYAAKVFQTLLPYHGLAVINTNGLLVEGGTPQKMVTINRDGTITLPSLGENLSPELAHQLGEALITAAMMTCDD